MKKWITFYGDPAIGFPRLGWAIRFLRCNSRGFGIIKSNQGLILACWRSRIIERIRIPKV